VTLVFLKFQQLTQMSGYLRALTLLSPENYLPYLLERKSMCVSGSRRENLLFGRATNTEFRIV